MNEGQNKRHIGRGMKPRGNKAVKPQKETKSMTDQSTTEGHETPPKEAVLEPEEGNETPGNLEAEKGEKSLQILEENEATVAQDSALEAALNESGDVIDGEFEEVPEVEHVLGSAAAPIIITAEQAKGFGYEQPGGYDIKIDRDKLQFTQPSGKVGFRKATLGDAIGLQPDGSTKVIVTIQEGYFEAVKDWAESDGVSVERWLSDRLYEYISTYGAPAGKR